MAKQNPWSIKDRLLLRADPKDWILKVISLCLGILIWYFVVGEDQVDMNVQVPLEIINLPPDLVISNQFKKDIDVSVRGPRSLMQDLRNRNITRPVDLSGKKSGAFVLQNDPDSISFPRGITVLRLQPTNIALLLDQLIKKNFPIEAVTKGRPASGFVLERIILDPNHLIISGSKTVLDSETFLKTYTIDIDNLNHSTTLQVNLNLKPGFIDLIGETVVTAQLDIREKLQTRTVNNIPINVRDMDQPVSIYPNNVSVTADIPSNLIKNTPKLSMLFRASISAKGIMNPTTAQVAVSGVDVPGHDTIIVSTIKPTQVLVSPIMPSQGKTQADTSNGSAPSASGSGEP